MLSSASPSWGDKGKTSEKARKTCTPGAGESRCPPSHMATGGLMGLLDLGRGSCQLQGPGQGSVGRGDLAAVPQTQLPHTEHSSTVLGALRGDRKRKAPAHPCRAARSPHCPKTPQKQHQTALRVTSDIQILPGPGLWSR